MKHIKEILKNALISFFISLKKTEILMCEVDNLNGSDDISYPLFAPISGGEIKKSPSIDLLQS